MLALEKGTVISQSRKHCFDVWFLSRYYLTECIRLSNNDFTTKSIAKRERLRINFQLSQLLFIFRLKKKVWIFPNERTLDPVTGRDKYVYPHLSEVEILETVNMCYNCGQSFKFNAVVRIIARLISYLFYFPVFSFQKKILSAYDHAFILGPKNLSNVTQHALRQYAMYQIYYILLKIFKPPLVHFSDRSDKFPLILACKKRKIPMVEYQHGLPLQMKFNYDFGVLNKQLFSHITFKYCYPIKRYIEVLSRLGMKLIPIDSRLMKYNYDPIKKKQSQKNILIIMQSEFYDVISEFDFAKHPLANFQIKPHPAEDACHYAHLQRFKNIEVLSSKSEVFYQCLPNADVVIGFYSTALVEASILNKRCVAISGDDELSLQLATIFKIRQIKMEDIQLEMGSLCL